MVLTLLRIAHDCGSSLPGYEFPRPPFGLHDGLRLGEVGALPATKGAIACDVPAACVSIATESIVRTLQGIDQRSERL